MPIAFAVSMLSTRYVLENIYSKALEYFLSNLTSWITGVTLLSSSSLPAFTTTSFSGIKVALPSPFALRSEMELDASSMLSTTR